MATGQVILSATRAVDPSVRGSRTQWWRLQVGRRPGATAYPTGPTVRQARPGHDCLLDPVDANVRCCRLERERRSNQ